MSNNIIYIIILLLGFPAGIILVYLCKDEIKSWKKRFLYISVTCFAFSIGVFFMNFKYKLPVIITLLFMTITFATIIWKSVDFKNAFKKHLFRYRKIKL